MLISWHAFPLLCNWVNGEVAEMDQYHYQDKVAPMIGSVHIAE